VEAQLMYITRAVLNGAAASFNLSLGKSVKEQLMYITHAVQHSFTLFIYPFFVPSRK